MQNKTLTSTRSTVYKFLSTLYRDEIPKDLIAKMQSVEFLEKLSVVPETCGIQILEEAIGQLVTFLKSGDTEKIYREMSYEYASLFLNVGQNPVFPYESVHVSGEPVVMQKPVVKLREFFRNAGVHKSFDYKDLEEHIAVELEFLSYLLDKKMLDEFEDFF